jgi:hypothetical protein
VGGCRDVRFGYMWEWVMPRSSMRGFCGDLYPEECCGNIRILYSSPGGSRHTGHISLGCPYVSCNLRYYAGHRI